MPKFFRYIRANYSKFLKVLFFLITFCILIISIPREGKFRFEFQKGSPWMHTDLFAPFDFPVYKTDAELFAERHAILKGLKPFFSLDSTVVITVQGQFISDLAKSRSRPVFRIDGRVVAITPEVQAHTLKLMQGVYAKGIIDPTELSAIGTNPEAGITMLLGNVAYDTPLSALFTVEGALDFLSDQIIQQAPSNLVVQPNQYTELPLRKYILPNLIPEQQTTAKLREEMLRNLSLTKGLVQSGERIVSRGEMISPELFIVLESLRREYEGRMGFAGDSGLLILGQSLLISIILLVLYLFLKSFRSEVLSHNSKTIFILMLICLMVVTASLIVQRNTVSVYLVPFAIVPIFVRAFYDSRLALFVHLIILFMVGFFVPNSFEFVFFHFIAGIVAIISLTNFYQRRKLFLTVFTVLITYCMLYLGMVTIQEGTPAAANPLRLAWFIGNALLLLAAYQLIYLFEKVFGFLSDTSLMELSDTNQPLLRKLAEVAPGTFQHSLQVANLAEEAIFQIGGNALLVRVGALYHDIGKINKPYYFVENQTPDYNPHQNLDFEESAQLIIGHVDEGVQIARKHKLPQQLINFIRTHHGTTKAQYFFRLFKGKFPDATDEFSKFSYPGPIPFSREMAVLMMADSVEAASRSLRAINPQTIDELVESIISMQQAEGQYNESDITFKDITQVKQLLKKKLLNIYHSRIEYPKEVEA